MISVDWTQIVLTIVGAALGSGAAAYGGAYLAYRGERRFREAEERRKHLHSARSSLVVLTQQFNLLLHYKQSVIDPVRGSQYAWLSMKPVSVGGRAGWNLDFRSLEFLLSSKYGELLFDIDHENRRFFSAVDMIEQRVQFVVSQIQPRIADLALDTGATITEAQLVEALGRYRIGSAITYADEVISHVEGSVESASKVIDRLVAVLKEEFPKERFYYGSKPKAQPPTASQRQ